jgi:pSer/pThr/pTyr-binding forkhead associated (FHA) protein
MIKCPTCQTRHPNNTIFCEECGTYLPESDQKETDILVVTGETWPEREETSGASGEGVTSPLGLKLTILDSGRDVEVPLTKEVNIGRLDPASASFPDIDLTSDGGLGKGISRRHAKITRRGSEVFIEDLGSINGTFLNRERLKPYLSQALKSGDELQLGKLVLRVSFK